MNKFGVIWSNLNKLKNYENKFQYSIKDSEENLK